MVNLIKIDKNGKVFITPFASANDAKQFIDKTVSTDIVFSCKAEGYMVISPNNCDDIYTITNSDRVDITIDVPGGKLVANTTEPSYPGIDIEYIADNENKNADDTRFRVLVEKPCDTKTLSAMIWNNKHSEDYSNRIIYKEQ